MLMQHTGRLDTGWDLKTTLSKRRSKQLSLPDLVESTNATAVYAPDVEIYGEGEPSEYFYRVVSGAVRTYKMLVDGRRQICAFHLRGDLFGLESDDEHAFSAETIVNSKIRLIKRAVLMAQAEYDNEVARRLWTMTGDELKRVQAHVLLLIKTAKERVAEFLLEMAERGSADETVELPMSRQDIADYLGLTIETVSRTLTDLERNGTIFLPNSRRVVLRNRDALSQSCG
jgi:CRP/FNR family nitrogen fixation transcriptional regulator